MDGPDHLQLSEQVLSRPRPGVTASRGEFNSLAVLSPNFIMTPFVNKISVSFAAALAVFPVCVADVVISEIMYHPNSTNLLQEWIELHNTGAATGNLSGWPTTTGGGFTL